MKFKIFKERRFTIMQSIPTRTQAFELLKKYNKNENLIKHALAVESVMLHFAGLFMEADLLKWQIAGLIHDIDYEMFPGQHCKKAREILSEENWPEDYIHAVECHGWKICSDVEPTAKMEKLLYAIDELTGLITATVLLRPGKNIMELETRSVMKKWKQKNFAAGVNREVIEEGAGLLGIELEFLVEETIKGMQRVAAEIGLSGG
jgi:putative nucleotidyltransferase with HDIG domain